ncbi:SpaA isopeptide-forming pilin-related protein, partial [Enterococcus quebecensis]
MKRKIIYLFLSLVLMVLAITSLGGRVVEATQGNNPSWSTSSVVNDDKNGSVMANDYMSNLQSRISMSRSLSPRFFSPVSCGGVQVIKYDGQTKARLSGAQFTIYNRWNRAVQVIQSGYDGIAETRTLPLGNYSIRETKAPTGYQLENAVMRFSVFVPGQVVCLTKCNTPLPNQKGSLQVVKTDGNNQRLAGAQFDVYNSNNQFVGRITTNINGVATLGNLSYGTYKLIEVKAPVGYELDATPKYVTLSALSPNKVASIIISNKKIITKGSIEIIKKDETGKLLAGAQFFVVNSSNTVVGQVTTNANGVATVTNLPYGTYNVVEYMAPEGYELDQTWKPITLSKDSPNGKASITIVNKKKITTGALKVIKKDEAGKLLAGAEFEVRNASGKVVGKITTDANGIGTIKDLPFGDYTVVETKAPSGYELDATPKNVKVSKGDPNGVVTITVENKKEKTTG